MSAPNRGEQGTSSYLQSRASPHQMQMLLSKQTEPYSGSPLVFDWLVSTLLTTKPNTYKPKALLRPTGL